MTNARGNCRSAAMGVSAILMMLAAASGVPAQTITTLHSFHYYQDGAFPAAALVQAANGNLYGTTMIGVGNQGGTAFESSPDGSLQTLFSFCSKGPCQSGVQPAAPLLLAYDGNLYGTTGMGGAGKSGSVFKITPSGTLTTLYSFCSQDACRDGSFPEGALIQASDGTFYGTTLLGGAYPSCSPLRTGCGTIFRITPGGTLTTLYSFCSGQGTCADGAYPAAGVVEGADESFYGTTGGGGFEVGCYLGCGTVFRITATGALTNLHYFCPDNGCADGANPAALVQAADGDFYGTTEYGGTTDYGTIFRITGNGTLTTLHRFDDTDGFTPIGALIQASDGNFYGTTISGGANLEGTVFGITSSGTLRTLYNFCAKPHCSDGSGPNAGLVQATDGTFYGTTLGGGKANGGGTIFSLSVGLGPFVKTVPTTGRTGRSVVILGTNLTGATSVIFNGTPATFTVGSPTAITTTVPTGATTGPVHVVTPNGTLTSNLRFQVLP